MLVLIRFVIKSWLLMITAKTAMAFYNDVNVRHHRAIHNDKMYSIRVMEGHDSIGDLTTSTSDSATTTRYITFPGYRSSLLSTDEQWDNFLCTMESKYASSTTGGNHDVTKELVPVDLFWEQILHEAQLHIEKEPMAGVQLYYGILLHPSLMVAICTIIAYEIATELITATTIKDLFLSILNNPIDRDIVREDLLAVTIRDVSTETAMEAVLFHKGFHALVCYRVGHRLWQSKRIGLAYYIQSIVSRVYSADIHPACTMGTGIYLRIGVGGVIGETAVVGNDVSIFEGVTLGGTGKESGDRHPKIQNGVIIYDGGTVLGNIHIGEGSIISAKSIVTKPLPPLAIVSGVPAKIQSFRNLDDINEINHDSLQQYLAAKYLSQWRLLQNERLANETKSE